MMSRDIRNRLTKLEAIPQPGEYQDIERLIKERVCYDELTEEQKQRYFSFIETDKRDELESLWLFAFGDLHFPIAKFDPPTVEELKRIEQDIRKGTLCRTE